MLLQLRRHKAQSRIVPETLRKHPKVAIVFDNRGKLTAKEPGQYVLRRKAFRLLMQRGFETTFDSR